MLGGTIIPLSVRASVFSSRPRKMLTQARRDVVGSETLEELADTVWRAVGPSGRNKVCMRTCVVLCADDGGRTMCITSLLLFVRWRQRRTTRISLLSKYVP